MILEEGEFKLAIDLCISNMPKYRVLLTCVTCDSCILNMTIDFVKPCIFLFMIRFCLCLWCKKIFRKHWIRLFLIDLFVCLFLLFFFSVFLLFFFFFVLFLF